MKKSLDSSIVYRGLKKDIRRRYGKEKAEVIWQYAGSLYRKLLKKYPGGESQHKAFVYPAVAIYRAIEHYAPGEALTVTRNYGTRLGKNVEKIIRAATALPGVPDLMWKHMDGFASKMSDGYEIKNKVVNEHECDLDVTGCHLYDCAKRLKTPEAVQMICCMDKEYMNGFRGVRYKRTMSVAEGDDICDYRLSDSRKESQMDLDKKKAFKNLLIAEVGKDEAETIWNDAKKRLADIESRFPDIPKGVRMHTDFIFPSAAMYLAIKEAKNAELGYKIISTVSWSKSKKMGKMLAGMSKLPGFNNWFVKMWDPISHKSFGENSGFQNKFYPNKKGEFRMDILQCPYNRYFTELGCPELTKIFCTNDECSYGNIPGIEFIRTQTLGRGGEKCDFYIRTTNKSR